MKHSPIASTYWLQEGFRLNLPQIHYNLTLGYDPGLYYVKNPVSERTGLNTWLGQIPAWFIFGNRAAKVLDTG